MNKKLVLAILLVFISNALYASPQVAIIKTAQEVKSARGIIISGSLFREYPADSITRVNPREVHVIFSAPAPVAGTPAYITAMAVSDAGVALFSDLRLTEPFSYQSKVCRALLDTPESIEGRQSHLFSLLDIREARRQVLKEQLKLLTTESNLKELNNLERLFGLDLIEPITRNTNVYELIDRLSRLKDAIKDMK
jgi:hypothetical protein